MTLLLAVGGTNTVKQGGCEGRRPLFNTCQRLNWRSSQDHCAQKQGGRQGPADSSWVA